MAQVRLLGGVGAVAPDGTEADLGPPKSRLVLAALALHHGEAVPVAIGLARTDPNPEIRRMAVFCLAKLAPGEAAATLQDAMQDPSAAVRQAAVLGLESPDQKTNASRE